MNHVNVGLVGYGVAGAAFHAPLIAAEPRLSLKSVVTSRAEKLAADHPGARAVPDLDAVLADKEIGLVVIATPNDTHAPFARAALEAGKAVVVDKPFTPTVAEAEGLVALAAEKGLPLGVFHNRRWDDGFLTVRRLLADGALGTPAHYEAHFDRFRPSIKPGWREEGGEGSGLFYDLGPHLVDQALVLFGKPRAVTADLARQRPGVQVDDWFHLVLDYGPLRVILHAGMLTCLPGAVLTVHGTGGSYVKYGLDPQEAVLRAGGRPGPGDWAPTTEHGTLHLPDGGSRVVRTEPGDYPAFYGGVAASLLDGTPMPVPGEDAVAVMRVIDAARRSAAEGRRVEMA